MLPRNRGDKDFFDIDLDKSIDDSFNKKAALDFDLDKSTNDSNNRDLDLDKSTNDSNNRDLDLDLDKSTNDSNNRDLDLDLDKSTNDSFNRDLDLDLDKSTNDSNNDYNQANDNSGINTQQGLNFNTGIQATGDGPVAQGGIAAQDSIFADGPVAYGSGSNAAGEDIINAGRNSIVVNDAYVRDSAVGHGAINSDGQVAVGDGNVQFGHGADIGNFANNGSQIADNDVTAIGNVDSNVAGRNIDDSVTVEDSFNKSTEIEDSFDKEYDISESFRDDDTFMAKDSFTDDHSKSLDLDLDIEDSFEGLDLL